MKGMSCHTEVSLVVSDTDCCAGTNHQVSDGSISDSCAPADGSGGGELVLEGVFTVLHCSIFLSEQENSVLFITVFRSLASLPSSKLNTGL